MSENAGPAVGKISWFDLTVEDAGKVRDFYSDVVGWKHSDVDMGGYDDFTMLAPAGGEAVAGGRHSPATTGCRCRRRKARMVACRSRPSTRMLPIASYWYSKPACGRRNR